MPDALIFRTDAVPARDRFAAFYEEFVRRHVALEFRLRDDGAAFRGAIALRRAGAINIGLIETSACDSIRTRSLVRDGDDCVYACLCEDGGGYQSQSGDPGPIAKGAGILLDATQVGGLHLLKDTRFWTVRVPREQMARLVPRVARFSGMKLHNPAALRLLFGYLRGAYDIEWNHADRAGQLYGDHLVELIGLALDETDDPRRQEQHPGIAAVRRAAILRQIETNAHDPRLGAGTVASRLGITTRYLRLLLEATGKSFSEHLLHKRLDLAAALLRDPQRRDRKISDIAFACGFSDLSYFNRSFRRLHGATPSDIREGRP